MCIGTWSSLGVVGSKMLRTIRGRNSGTLTKPFAV
jgi:hypothetical protein